MLRRPPRSTRPDTLLPYTTLFLSEPIVRGLFQYGRFTVEDAERCGWALSAFSIGLPSYVLVKVLTPGYYARGDTKTPVRYAMLSILINIIGNIVLIPLLGHVGPPLATALRSEARRVGKEGGSTCRYRRSPD